MNDMLAFEAQFMRENRDRCGRCHTPLVTIVSGPRTELKACPVCSLDDPEALQELARLSGLEQDGRGA